MADSIRSIFRSLPLIYRSNSENCWCLGIAPLLSVVIPRFPVGIVPSTRMVVGTTHDSGALKKKWGRASRAVRERTCSRMAPLSAAFQSQCVARKGIGHVDATLLVPERSDADAWL
jgi:hypothetical protein